MTKRKTAGTPARGARANKAKAKEAELEALRAELAESREKLQRALAEAENLRKRHERERAQAELRGICRLAEALLPLSDALARARRAQPPLEKDPSLAPFLEGLEGVEQQFLKALERHGIKRIEPSGLFDPHRHEALFETPSSDLPAGSIIEVVEAGFVAELSHGGETLERLLRPARVGVARGAEPQKEESQEDSQKDETPQGKSAKGG